MRGRNCFWLLLLLIFSAQAYSSTLVTFVATYGGISSGPRSSEATACAALKGMGGLFPNYTAAGATAAGSAGGACMWKTTSQQIVYYGTWEKFTTTCAYGDNGTSCNVSCVAPNIMEGGQCVKPACPVGQQRNASSGQCEPYACPQDSSGDEAVYSPKQAKCTKYFNLDTQEYCNYSGQKKTPTTQPLTIITNDPDGVTQGVDNFKCGIDVATKQCAQKVDGTHRCIVTGTSNGTYYPNATDNNVPNCPSGTCTTPPETPVPEVPKPETTTDSKPCNYTSVNGALECTSSSTENKEGTKNCGTVNGVWQCVKSPPSSNGISIVTKVTTESTPDGGTKTTKTDTATQTKCTDIGKCTSSTTTNVNVTIKDGQGNVTSTTGTCKGDNCPDKNGNPDGNGDGFGDCVGDDCGGGSGGPSNAELEEVPTFGDTTQSLINRVKSSNVAQSLTGITVPSSGVCPTYSAETYIGTVEYESHCEIVEPKRDLIKVIMRGVWAFVAILFFFGG